jgi:hypothetical protein
LRSLDEGANVAERVKILTVCPANVAERVKILTVNYTDLKGKLGGL